MKIFAYARQHPEEILAITDNGEKILYGEMNTLAEALKQEVGRRLVFILCRNTPGSLLGYLSLMQAGSVPLLLDADMAPRMLEDLADCYHPAFCLVPEDKESLFGERRPLRKIRDYLVLPYAESGEDPALAPELQLLLSTSGSTGSQKLVRISANNLDANAESIVAYLQITKKERPITVLPMQYSYGMSIIHSHVMVGAPILLTRHTLMDRSFWDRVREEGATSLCGVPYTFEIYLRVGLLEMDLPSLGVITQAGGKLPEERHMQIARWCADRGIRFYVMYGQTEASPRMGWLPPEMAIQKCGSMGIAIPGGKLDLIDEKGNPIPQDLCPERKKCVEPGSFPPAFETTGSGEQEGMSPVGELVYTGANVSLGYALCPEDLQKGDERHGVLHTGDMACRDADGYFYITGRLSRFIKIGGKRLGLDETEKLLRRQFPGLNLVCAGKDEELRVFIETAEEPHDLKENICACLQDMTGVPENRIRVVFIKEIPRNRSGKIRYAELNSM